MISHRTLCKPLPESTGELSISPPSSDARDFSTHPVPGAVRGAASGKEGTPQLSRRSMVAALAAGLIPAAAPALAVGGGGRGPDAELLEHGRRYLDLVTLEAAADEAYERC